ncbi:MAG: calcium-binding protein [Archangium sp.]|nr:calcium-binding protein [Archangium sp.]MDP3153727.1 calcium-binding protein [Archangium sp.]MDP3569224.1 calcium-binding protein [Archangium sp.]
MKILRKTLLALSLSVGAVACQGGQMTEEETLVGEASAALTVAEESGDVTADAVGGETATELTASGDESAVLPQAPDGDGVCDLGARKARVLARYDANGDGRLGPVERDALRDDLQARVGHPVALRFGLIHRAHVIKRLQWVFDTNLDGSLSADERTAMVDALEARCERLRAQVIERFDANADGSLDATEKQAAKDALVARIQAFRQQVLTQYDANTNGVLDDGERQQLRSDRIAAFQARRAAVVAQFDVNDDGTLDDAEKRALKQAITQRIIEGRDAE